MKWIRLIPAFCITMLFFSCQKELSYELNPVTVPTSTTATYSLGGASAVCAGFVLTGTYMGGTQMVSGNTATLQANVTKTGSYSFSTNTINGVSFSAAGSFSATGMQNVVLTATGTPTAAGSQTYSVTGDTATCKFDVIFAAAAPPAVFTLAGAPGACTLPVINGTYSATVPVTAANTMVIKVNVTTAGAYKIATNTVNGLSFSASGVFATTGTNVSVTLAASGTPLAAGTTTLTPSFSGSSCTFSVTVAAAPAIPSGTYSCKIDGVASTFTVGAAAGLKDPLSSTPYLSLQGDKDSLFESYFQIFISNNDQTAVTAGTYDGNHYIPTSSTSLGYRIEVDYSVKNADLSTTIWNTSSNIPPLISGNPAFTITVSSITGTRAKGTFSGKLTNTLQGGTLFKTITEGVFDLPIQ